MRFSGTLRRPARLPVVRISGPAFPDCHYETSEDFGTLVCLELKEEEVVLMPDFAEETLVPPPAAVPTGRGSLRYELSLGQQPQEQANVRNDSLRKLNELKALWNLVSKFLFDNFNDAFVPQPEAPGPRIGDQSLLPGNHCK